ncbi:MAG: rhamnogalacturonan acetylesterase [Clostridia bacterium]|nr:rhamnogalacturonan acetylesterase [Clostridia bacterium]
MADLFSHPSEASSAFDQSGWLNGTGDRSVQIQSVPVPHFGRYRVKVKTQGASVLFGQRRNLIKADVPNGETSFYTCLTEYIPSMQNKPDENLALYASTYGGGLSDMRAEECAVRTVFIAGDSTVADQYAVPYYPFESYCGWGQMLAAFLPEDAVCNMAHSGLTARCFMEDGHFGIVLKHMRPVDLCLIQFGHNDQKRRYLQADQQYKDYLKRICDQVIPKGAKPVLVSPISRVPSRDEAGVFDLLEDHASAVRSLAQENRLPFIDLHKYSFDLFCSMGEGCRSLFKDMTHPNDPGAFRLAKYVARQLEAQGLARFHEAVPGFIASDKEKSPSSAPGGPLPVPYTDIDEVRNKSVVFQGVQKGLLDPCVLHMHPFEPVTRAAFIQMLFRAARIPSSPTNGRFPYTDIKPREFDAGFAQTCRLRGLVTGDRYRPNDIVTTAEANELFLRAGLSCRVKERQGLPCKLEIVEALLKTM